MPRGRGTLKRTFALLAGTVVIALGTTTSAQAATHQTTSRAMGIGMPAMPCHGDDTGWG